MGVPHHSIWRDPALEITLRKCILDGDSSQTCADKMGLTRSAVIGKASRLKLSFKGVNDAAIKKRVDGRAKATATKQAKPKPPKAPSVKRDQYQNAGLNLKTRTFVPNIKAEPIHSKLPESFGKKSLMELTRLDCRFVCDDGKYCADRIQGGGSWCEDHRKIVFWHGVAGKRPMTANELVRSLRKFA